MGNASSTREGERNPCRGGAHGGPQEPMCQSPPHSPMSAQSPLLFTPQVPAVPMQRQDEMGFSQNEWMQNAVEFEDMFYEQGIPTMITWSYGGKDVAVEGSWDNWKTRKTLHRSGKDFTIVKVLPSGVYQYRFIVDGEWKYAPDMPWMPDDTGNPCNVLDLEETVPEDISNIACFEPPESPVSSYNGWQLGSEDYSKDPPLVPHHLSLTTLNTYSSSSFDGSTSPSRPRHVVLNHLYIQKGKSGQSVVALGSSYRFLAKYVTVVLYKYVQR
ncbi:SNF1-related protein kinase regulatory subunit beta-2 [Acorus gramineus]|uniref:SNF1-related protein kinase regulatory subunit beta-2 n=1 Tax=Acorus gramineus TaxID=55184 RepID=A0AAV9AX92_ACOGR|nr:SNF1-related protein kinase regulatory subunit beta-2 [Acorus gramineus]